MDSAWRFVFTKMIFTCLNMRDEWGLCHGSLGILRGLLIRHRSPETCIASGDFFIANWKITKNIIMFIIYKWAIYTMAVRTRDLR